MLFLNIVLCAEDLVQASRGGPRTHRDVRFDDSRRWGVLGQLQGGRGDGSHVGLVLFGCFGLEIWGPVIVRN